MKVDVGSVFGKLTVVEFSHKVKKNKYWWAECSCADKTRKIVSESSMRSGHSRSCGCIKKNQEFDKKIARKYPEPKPGDVFGRLTVISLDRKDKHSWWLCSCSCGGSKVVKQSSLVGGITRSCGCIRKEVAVVNGQKARKYEPAKPGDIFGRLTLISLSSKGCGEKHWLCQCSCGEQAVVREIAMHRGLTQSCGCLQRERTSQAKKTHGLSKDKEFMKARSKIYRTLHKKRLSAHTAEYNKLHPELVRERAAVRRARIHQAIPKWDDGKVRPYFVELAKKAKQLEEATGVKYHVDHIIPLKGKINGVHAVCGLHTCANLQLLPDHLNLEKQAYYWPGMPT